MIVLDEFRRDERPELFEMESLHEEPPRIAVDIQLNELKAFNVKWDDLHRYSAESLME
jgi:hypothetical protein